MSTLMSIGKFAKATGVTSATLRRMHKTGELVPVRVTDGGTRYYSQEQLSEFLSVSANDKIIIGYCRVLSDKYADDLNDQVNLIKSYMCAKGYNFIVLSDIGSGFFCEEDGVRRIVSLIVQKKVGKLVVYRQSVISGLGYLRYLCSICDVCIEVIDKSDDRSFLDLEIAAESAEMFAGEFLRNI